MKLQDTLRNAFIYSPDLTPIVTSISPSSGPLNGGTVVTFQGRGLLPEGDFADYFDGWFLTAPGVGPAGTVNATEVPNSTNMVCHASWDPHKFAAMHAESSPSCGEDLFVPGSYVQPIMFVCGL